MNITSNTATTTNNVWIKLQKGKQGDLVGFHKRQLVLIRDTKEAVEGDYVRVSGRPSKAGNCLVAQIDLCETTQTWAIARVPEGVDPKGPKAKDEAIKAFVRMEIEARRQKAEQAERFRLAKEALKAERERREAEAGTEGAQFVEALERFDAYYAFSDDPQVVRQGEAIVKQLQAAWTSLPASAQEGVLLDGRLDGKMRALQLA